MRTLYATLCYAMLRYAMLQAVSLSLYSGLYQRDVSLMSLENEDQPNVDYYMILCDLYIVMQCNVS
jgi:hypothetical protein